MIIVKGDRVSFDLSDGRELDAPSMYGMLHDPSGRHWPRCSVLVAPYIEGRKPASTDLSRDYFGDEYETYEGEVDLPPKPITRWERVGELKEIWYRRWGQIHPGDFRHKFRKKKGLWSYLFGPKWADLYRLGDNFRVELRGGCILNERGFVAP